MKIIDTYGRTFNTLRISLINTCNLACTYCVNEDLKEKKHGAEQVPLEIDGFIAIVHRLNEALNLQTVRLTGGEPTLYRDLVPLIKGLKHIGVLKIKLTTNGLALKTLINKIDEHDLHSINVSLDALDEDIFFQISRRRSLHKILEGIDAALDKGIKVKLNCVVLKGINTNQIIPLMEYAGNKGIDIRFLEMMKMGHLYENQNENFFAEAAILDEVAKKYSFTALKREAGATSNYWQTEEGFLFGIIANESSPFCNDCNRLRLDSFGNIYGCLSSSESIAINDSFNDENKLRDKLLTALAQKQPLKFTGSALSMLEIGG